MQHVGPDLARRADVTMSWDEVHERYPDQWVVLVETDWIENHFAFRSTRVLGHGVARAEVLDRVRPRLSPYPGYACFFTGRVRAPRDGFALL